MLMQFRLGGIDHFFRGRPEIVGPESRMVAAFMRDYKSQLEKTDGDYAIFYEPQMPTGYPDCVVVKYHASAYDDWKADWNVLTERDAKVLTLIASSRGWSIGALANKGGFAKGPLRQSLSRLEQRGFVRQIGTRWTSSFRKYCGVESVVAIEAKMSDCRKVLDQAVLNRTFSDESYVLLAAKHPSANTMAGARDSGLGVYVMSENGKCVRLQKPIVSRRKAYSYARWYFNEWIGRRIVKERSACQ